MADKATFLQILILFVVLIQEGDCKRKGNNCKKDSHCPRNNVCVRSWQLKQCVSKTDLCPKGDDPKRDEKGELIFCTGPDACDIGYECTKHSRYGWIILCCPCHTPAPPQTCENGEEPLRNENGEIINCGYGKDREGCPFNYYCRQDTRYNNAVCCNLAKPGTCEMEPRTQGAKCRDDAECPGVQKCCQGANNQLYCTEPVEFMGVS